MFGYFDFPNHPNLNIHDWMILGIKWRGSEKGHASPVKVFQMEEALFNCILVENQYERLNFHLTNLIFTFNRGNRDSQFSSKSRLLQRLHFGCYVFLFLDFQFPPFIFPFFIYLSFFF